MYFPGNGKAGQAQRAPSHAFRRVTSVAPPLNVPQMNGELPAHSLCAAAVLSPDYCFSACLAMPCTVCLLLLCIKAGRPSLCQPLAHATWLPCKSHGAWAAGTLEKSDLWTQSRANLEEAIEEEKENTDHNWDSDLLSHEQRLEQRLDKLKLDMFIMGSDGACQVSLPTLPHSCFSCFALPCLAWPCLTSVCQ